MKRLREGTMRKALSTVLLLSLLLVVSSRISVATPLPQEQRYEITSPRPNQQVRGSVEIIGTARLPEFQFYKVEYASAAQPDAWTPIGDLQWDERTDARLETWHTSALPDGTYYLRLAVVKEDGNFVETDPVTVRIANAQPAPTPTPAETPTPTPTIVLPTPTTAIVEQPTVIRAGPTATRESEVEAPPTAAPDASATVSIPDVGAFVRQFVFGAFVATVIFLFVGVVFLLKRFV
ncbi:MAG: hypothetical protein WBB22_07865 [Anaerolineae bacterium]